MTSPIKKYMIKSAMPFSSAGAPSASMTIRSVVSGLRCTKPTSESMIAVMKFIPILVYIPTKVGKNLRISINCRKFGG